MLEGYGIEEDKWRLAKDVKSSKWLVSEFHCRNPEAPQHMLLSSHVGPAMAKVHRVIVRSPLWLTGI